MGIDSFFYRPPSEAQLGSYAAALPTGFECVSKVWEEITVPVWPRHTRYGPRGGEANPHFMDPVLCNEAVMEPYRRAFVGHTGPLVFEFQQMSMGQREFCERLDRFLGALPGDLPLAVEVRNRNFVTPRYFKTLAAHGVAHCFNQWQRQMPLAEQVRLDPAWTAPHVVARLLLASGVSYAQAVAAYKPYDRIQKRQPEVRAAAVELAERATAEQRSTYLLVNTRLEGSSPLTITELIEKLDELP